METSMQRERDVVTAEDESFEDIVDKYAHESEESEAAEAED